jgi:Zn-dependent peptidase ImmA (M78 family)
MRTAASLDAMGRAYLAENGEGYLADAYFEAIRKLAARHDADADALLGFVIAHELGHLILGEGHVPDGVMQAQWGGAAVKALERR